MRTLTARTACAVCLVTATTLSLPGEASPRLADAPGSTTGGQKVLTGHSASPAWSFAPTSKPKLIATLPVTPITLGGRRVSVLLDITQVRRQLLIAARSSSETLLLELGGVEAARQPGVVWRIYLRSPASATFTRRALVGDLALYGAGIHQSGRPFTPASFAFPADAAAKVALGDRGRMLKLTFVPSGPLVNGKPTAPKPASKVIVGRVSFAAKTNSKP
jgi:hypothetical protein